MASALEALSSAATVLKFVEIAAKITLRFNHPNKNIAFEESKSLVAAINDLNDTLANSNNPVNDEFVAVRVEAKALAYEMLQLSKRIARIRALGWRWPSLTGLLIPSISKKKISQVTERCRNLVSFTQLWM